MANVEVVHEENGDIVCYATNSPTYEEITITDVNDDTEVLKLRIHGNDDQQQLNYFVQNFQCGSQPKGFVPLSFVSEPFFPQSTQVVTPVTPHHTVTNVDTEATCATSQMVSKEKKVKKKRDKETKTVQKDCTPVISHHTATTVDTEASCASSQMISKEKKVKKKCDKEKTIEKKNFTHVTSHHTATTVDTEASCASSQMISKEKKVKKKRDKEKTIEKKNFTHVTSHHTATTVDTEASCASSQIVVKEKKVKKKCDKETITVQKDCTPVTSPQNVTTVDTEASCASSQFVDKEKKVKKKRDKEKTTEKKDFTPLTSHHTVTTVDTEASCASSQIVVKEKKVKKKRDKEKTIEKKDFTPVTSHHTVTTVDTEASCASSQIVVKEKKVKKKRDKEKTTVRKDSFEKVNVASNTSKLEKVLNTAKLEKVLNTSKLEKVLNIKKEKEEIHIEGQESQLDEMPQKRDENLCSTMEFKSEDNKTAIGKETAKFEPEIVIKQELISDDEAVYEETKFMSTSALLKHCNAQLPFIKIEKMDIEKVKQNLKFQENCAKVASKKKIKKAPLKMSQNPDKKRIKRSFVRVKIEDIESNCEHLFQKKIPEGWKRIARQRTSGASAGKYDVYVYTPCGKRLRSSVEVGKYLEENGITDLNRRDFEFGVRSQASNRFRLDKLKVNKLKVNKMKQVKLMKVKKTEGTIKNKTNLKISHCSIDYDNPTPSTSCNEFSKVKKNKARVSFNTQCVIDYDNPAPSTSTGIFENNNVPVSDQPVKKKRKIDWKVKLKPPAKSADDFAPRKQAKSKSKKPPLSKTDFSDILHQYKSVLKGQTVTINLRKCDAFKTMQNVKLQPSAEHPKSKENIETLEIVPEIPQVLKELNRESPVNSSTDNLLEEDKPCSEPSSDILKSLDLIRRSPDPAKLLDCESDDIPSSSLSS